MGLAALFADQAWGKSRRLNKWRQTGCREKALKQNSRFNFSTEFFLNMKYFNNLTGPVRHVKTCTSCNAVIISTVCSINEQQGRVRYVFKPIVFRLRFIYWLLCNILSPTAKVNNICLYLSVCAHVVICLSVKKLFIGPLKPIEHNHWM